MEKTIGQQITKLQGTEKQKYLSVNCSLKQSLNEAYGNKEKFLIRFNPSWLSENRLSAYECICGNYPSLSQVSAEYGKGVATALIVAHLQGLNNYCGCKNKIDIGQLRECAMLISCGWGFLKVTELCLFFLNIKSGVYGEFFGALDPLRIATMLRQFVRERNDIIAKFENEQRTLEREEHEKYCVTYEEYLAGRVG